MSVLESYTTRNFELIFNMNGVTIENQIKLNESDIIFELSDGRRVLYDTFSNVTRVLRHNPRGYLIEEEIYEEFSRRLRNKLALNNFTQRDFAEELGMSEVTISNYVNGKSYPSISQLHHMCKILECSVCELTDFNYLL